MKETLENIALNNNWEFEYARKDFQNLYDKSEVLNKVHLFVDPIQRQNSFNEYGQIESTTYSGSLMLLMSSDFDEGGYKKRYNDYIKPLIDTAYQNLLSQLGCSKYTLTSTNTTEIINVLDYNFDGLLISFTANEQQ